MTQSTIANIPLHVDWRDLRFALEVARSKSITRAASNLRMTESTVSRHVSDLENSLGVHLFERTPSGMILTDAGQRLTEYLTKAEAQIESGLEAAHNVHNSPEGSVRLTTVPSIANHLLAHHAQPLLKKYPKLELELVGIPSELSMMRREADIAIRLARPAKEMNALTRKLGNLEYGVFAAKPDQDAASNSAELPWISYETDMSELPQSKWIARHTTETGETVSRLRCNDADGLIAATLSRSGKTLLPRMIASKFQDLEELNGFDNLPSRELWLIVHPNLATTERYRVVVDWLIDLFATI